MKECTIYPDSMLAEVNLMDVDTALLVVQFLLLTEIKASIGSANK